MADGQVSTRAAAKPQQAVNDDVWSALCAAQDEFGGIGKSATGQARGGKYQYAPLDEVLETLGPVLRKHGLTSTSLTIVEGEWMKLKRTLHHAASNTEISGEYPVANIGKPPQEIGSALTYARRYSLLALCDVHPTDEDDDCAKASAKPAVQARSAHSLRKEDVWPPLIKALKLVETKAEFAAWEEANAEIVEKFPAPWREQLDEEIEKHREHLAEQRRLARQAAEALS
jgi:hypothetical protein